MLSIPKESCLPTMDPPQCWRHFPAIFLRSELTPSAKLDTSRCISAWVVKLIRAAYASATDEDCRLAQASVHEVRAIASSLAYQATYALNDVLRAATWANPTTFIDHYLRDVSGLQGRLHVLAPCVVAGKTLN